MSTRKNEPIALCMGVMTAAVITSVCCLLAIFLAQALRGGGP